MFKITGLDTLQKNLREARQALSALDGELRIVQFDPNDPASIDAAVQSVELMIDERLGSYARNPLIGPLAEEMKEKYRAAIIERAAVVRLEGDADGK